MLNSVGLANPGLTAVAADHLPWLAARLGRAHILVNVVGFSEDEYGRVVEGLEDVPGVVAYEVNLSCPNTSAGGIEFGADPRLVREIIADCRRRTRRAVVAKLSPVLPDIAGMAAVARDAGADGVTVVNTLPGSLDDAAGRSRLGQSRGGVSGPALLPVGLAAVRRVRERLGDWPVLGVGGVRSAADVRSYLRAGASLVAIGTAALADPGLPERIIMDLDRHGL
jgi:dihydroorotate dehydrogenase (NAD+) catalytic subunit